MIYPALTFLTSKKEAGILPFHNGKMYGPYAVGGWEKHPLCASLRLDQGVFSYCAFKDGTMPIAIEEHDERIRAGEDFKKGVANLFTAGFFFYKVDIACNGEPIIIERSLTDYSGTIALYKFFQSQFNEAWKVAVMGGYTSEQAEEVLGCKFETD